MKTTTPELALHMSQENTTLARLLKISRLDGAVLRFTDFDADMQYDDGTGLLIEESLWTPLASMASPYWSLSGDALTGVGMSAPANYFPPAAPWAASMMFAGTYGFASASFFGTTTYVNGFTFKTVCSAHADSLNGGGSGSAGFVLSGVSTSPSWLGGDSYIGFQAYKHNGVAWGNWLLRLSDGTSTLLLDSGVPVGDTIGPGSTGGVRTTLTFTVNSDGTSVTWFIDGIAVGTRTTGVPTTAMSMYTAYDNLTYVGDLYYRVESMEISIPESSIGTYVSADGVTFSALSNKDDGSPNNTQVTGFLAAAGVTAEDVRARLYDGATFEYRIVNWADLSMREVKMLSGSVGDYELKNGLFTAQLRGLTQKLTSVIGSLYGPLCRAELFGGGAEGIDPTNHWKCRLNRADWVQNGEVQASTDSITVVPYNVPSVGTLVMKGSPTPLALAPAGWFDDGVIHFTSGALNGYMFEIATWDGNALVLFGGGPMPQSPAAGDTFEIEPGCDKRIETCYSKFNNVINHAGEANIPGLNVIGAVSRTQVPTS